MSAGKRLRFWLEVQAVLMRWDAKARIERAQRDIAWMMPRWLAYWCFIRVVVYGWDGNPTDQTIPQAMDRWYGTTDGHDD